MFIYVIKRLVLILPTLLLVLILSFFITRSVPGDQSSALMTLQGINLQSPNAAKEYERNYKALGLDRPSFYFSVLPDYYPSNLNSVINEDDRKLIQGLLDEKIPYVHIDNFIKTKKAFITSVNTVSRLSNVDIKPLLFAHHVASITHSIAELNKVDSLKYNTSFGQLYKIGSTLQVEKRTLFYPKLVWHGADNQFDLWIASALKGHWGQSIKDGQPVSLKIGNALRWTILLLVLNMFFTLLLVLPIGLFTGDHNQGIWDKVIGFVSLVLYSIPTFWLATLLIFYFTGSNYGGIANIFPTPGLWTVNGGKPFLVEVFGQYEQLILPIICLVANDIAFLSRIIRNNVMVQKQSYYYEYAIAKGLTQSQALLKHILPNILVPLITLVVNAIPASLSGTLLIEVIFNIPGMGRLMYDSIYSYDWSVVLAILAILSVTTIFFMLVADIAISWVNPKIKQGIV